MDLQVKLCKSSFVCTHPLFYASFGQTSKEDGEGMRLDLTVTRSVKKLSFSCC